MYLKCALVALFCCLGLNKAHAATAPKCTAQYAWSEPIKDHSELVVTVDCSDPLGFRFYLVDRLSVQNKMILNSDHPVGHRVYHLGTYPSYYQDRYQVTLSQGEFNG